MTEHYLFTANESRLRLDHYLADKLPKFSRSKIQSFIKKGQVTVNGLIVKSSLILQGKETIECYFREEYQEGIIKGEKMDIDILYEEDGFEMRPNCWVY